MRIVAELREFESLAGVWDSLLQKCRDDNAIYLTHEWLSTWWKHFGDGKKLNILLIEKERHVIGIVPLMRTEYRIGLIKLDALETIGVTNCNYVGLIPPENREEAISILLAYMEELAGNKVILRLPMIPEDSQFLNMLRRKSGQFSKNLVFQEKVMTLAPYIVLPSTWDKYYRSLSQKRRQILRRALENLEEAHNVGFQRYTADSLEEGLSEFFDLHQRRWQAVNVRSMFSNPRVREFYRDISSQFLREKWLHFSCLTVDSEVVSAIYGCIYNKKFYALTSARDILYLEYSVGHLHYLYLIRDAIKKELQEFDFLRGLEPYKLYWAKSVRRYTRVIIIKKGFWPGLRLKYLHAFLRLHEIKQYSLREIYYLRLLKRREMKEIKKMGLKMLEE